MDASRNSRDMRAEKRSKMRESLNSAFNDPLQQFHTPLAIRNISESIDNNSAELEGRIRKISDSSDEPLGEEPKTTSFYIDERQALVEDLDNHRREARRVAREALAALSPGSKKNELKRALKELDDTDSIILRERTALAADRMRVEYSMLSRPGSVKIGEAYMMAITDNLLEPAGSSYRKKHQRSGADQTSFKNRLLKAYNPEGSKLLTESQGSKLIWCPVSGKEFGMKLLTAAHIIPYSIGETNAAYLFGVKPHEGSRIIWSEKNGLMMNEDLEKIFDDGRMVIMPDPTDDNEFISIILCQDLKKVHCWAIDAPYGALHRRRLEFRTPARPGKGFLYVHALLTLFRRRRYNVPGWEKDRAEVFHGQIWATPKKWARKSMIEVLALEVGDSWEGIKEVEAGLGNFPNAAPPEEEKRMAQWIKYALEARASHVDKDDEDGLEDDDEDDE
ncbi:hypothetical protein AYL99_11723 [Fonsecaea erecta]|uniref:HNH nuclease domain-containing protein n=1 Tax=Fonsecaea erecta TaxID=1367422 RepID=A0A178Z302_9EURO|nr:hypothetical protein AYL99_11723 [Fonsecaea erecta]OAP54188.1 hypothetical protein AYL99_11723 [Fonsecaea erecta]